MNRISLNWFLCGCVLVLFLGGCVKNGDKFTILLPDLSDEPLYIGKRLDIEDIQNKCSEIERGNGSVNCHIETEKAFINLTIAKDVVASIYIREVDDNENPPELITAIAEANKLVELKGVSIKGLGDNYRLGGDELEITYDSSYQSMRRYYQLFVSSVPYEERGQLIYGYEEVDSQVDYTSLFSFKLSEQLMGRNPIDYECRIIHLVDLTLCTNKVYLDYLRNSHENSDIKRPNVREPHGVLLDGLEVVALHYSFEDLLSVDLNRLFGLYGGKMKFTQSSDKKAEDESMGANEYYTVNERGDLIIINEVGFYSSLSIDLYSNNSFMKNFYLKHQEASLNSQ